jgi:hypothetical protein
MPPVVNRKDTMDKPFPGRRNLLISASALTALSIQFVTIMMATMTQDKAVWNDTEVAALVEFLWAHRAQVEGGNFKDLHFNAAADHIVSEWSSGPVKSAKHCKTKWQSVSCHLLPSDQDRY